MKTKESLERCARAQIQSNKYTPIELAQEVVRLRDLKDSREEEIVFIDFAMKLLATLEDSDFEENKPLTDQNWNLTLPQSADSELRERIKRIISNKDPIAC